MRLRLVAIAGILVGLAYLTVTVDTQTTNPCATLPPASQTQTITVPSFPATLTVGVCQKDKDVNGNPTTISTFQVSVDGSVKFTGAITPKAPADANGDVYYETAVSGLTAGAHTVSVVPTGPGGAGAATAHPFVLKLPEGAPGAPSNVTAHP